MSSKFFNTLVWFQEQTKSSESPTVIYAGNQIQKRSKGRVMPWNQTEDLLKFLHKRNVITETILALIKNLEKHNILICKLNRQARKLIKKINQGKKLEQALAKYRQTIFSFILGHSCDTFFISHRSNIN